MTPGAARRRKHLGNDTFGARGCGQWSTYIVICTGSSARTDLCNAVADTPQARQE
jgi:hypothetical protein